MTGTRTGRRGSTTAWADIDLHALGRNLERLRLGLPPGQAVFGVVKADAYGHGAGPVGRALQRFGIDGLVVADMGEGITLRRAGVTAPVLVIDPPLPSQLRLPALHRLGATVTSTAEARALATAANRAGRTVDVHVRVDTGFAGFGAPQAGLTDVLAAVAAAPALRLEGLYTHLSGAYGPYEDGGLAELDRFGAAVGAARAAGLLPPLVHALSSPAFGRPLLTAAAARIGCTAVRCGAALFGIRMADGDPPLPLAPVMSVKARVTRVTALEPGDVADYAAASAASRRTPVAVLPFGFADGHHLHRLAGGVLLIRGRPAPVLGRPFMSGLLADVTDIPGVQPGDEAVLIGRQGDHRITTEDIAARSGLRPSAVPLLGPRVVRRYRTSATGEEQTE
ncbi:alanine racemase [Azospirillum sp. OGB3]|uniref:alanine racemase n=1 Tax=Azospirillum sp. OGB3 TaxID=2587012 RepID=UPI00160627C0|nr:alanine racemase [Azospirillum sp. OGB3]MBB3264655.1 alanine racemase [Azospirillum sp. OGB3]